MTSLYDESQSLLSLEAGQGIPHGGSQPSLVSAVLRQPLQDEEDPER